MEKLIRQARKAKGLTLQALADEMGVSKQLVWQWENGESDPRTHIETLSGKLDVPVSYFYGSDAAPNLIEKKFVLLSPEQRRLVESLIDSLLGPAEERPKGQRTKKA